MVTWVVAEVDPPFLQLRVVPPVVLGSRQDALAVRHQQGVRGQARHLGQALLVRRRRLGRQAEQFGLAVGAGGLRVWGRWRQTVGGCRTAQRGLVVTLVLGRVVLRHHVAAVARWQHGPVCRWAAVGQSHSEIAAGADGHVVHVLLRRWGSDLEVRV